MTFEYYEDAAHKTAKYPAGSDYVYLGLAGEAGEVANQRKKEIRAGSNRTEQILDELGDCLWYISQICRERGVSMSEVARYNIEKLEARDNAGKIISN